MILPRTQAEARKLGLVAIETFVVEGPSIRHFSASLGETWMELLWLQPDATWGPNPGTAWTSRDRCEATRMAKFTGGKVRKHGPIVFVQP